MYSFICRKGTARVKSHPPLVGNSNYKRERKTVRNRKEVNRTQLKTKKRGKQNPTQNYDKRKQMAEQVFCLFGLSACFLHMEIQPTCHRRSTRSSGPPLAERVSERPPGSHCGWWDQSQWQLQKHTDSVSSIIIITFSSFTLHKTNRKDVV